jgi:hypothetical protein
MNEEMNLAQLLRWRVAQAEADAPPAPRAARLLALTEPWWRRWPERFALLAAGLEGMHTRVGHAMEQDAGRGGSHPVPAVVARTNVETHSLADILYINLRDGTLRLRFQLRPMPDSPEARMEVTFVAHDTPQPLFTAPATLAPRGEYRLEIELPGETARAWQHLRVTDRMPFRFILRPDDET